VREVFAARARRSTGVKDRDDGSLPVHVLGGLSAHGKSPLSQASLVASHFLYAEVAVSGHLRVVIATDFSYAV
jgi:hypothetical protein